MSYKIPLNVKLDCLEMAKTKSYREVYNTYYKPLYPDAHYETFCRAMRRWKRKNLRDSIILDNANLNGNFYAHDATVQIDGNGNIVQAWVKQTQFDDAQWDELIETIKQDVKPVVYVPQPKFASDNMLEIPLFDMHFGVSDLEYYNTTLSEICDIIDDKLYDEINIIIGQDLFHNDDFEGRTTKGTQIDKVDMVKAWNDAYAFYFSIINHALMQTVKVRITYSKGNHDKSMAWAFVQLLKTIFPFIEFDDSLDARKCIYWNGCFIGLTHGQYNKSSANDLFQQFVMQFPEQFAKSKVREVHAGHLHSEQYKDCGIMIRRLSTGNKTDGWTDDNGYVGAHKRFMLFEYAPNRLKAIYYV